jgi:hypothetical protein
MTFGRRLAYAFRCLFALIFKGIIPADILEAFAATIPERAGARPGLPPRPAARPSAAPAPPATPPEDRGDRAIQLLALLQRDGRLVDFLLEDVARYSDAQIGAAVREVHANCRRAIERYLPLEPILPDEEGQTTTLGAPVDASTVKLIGNVGTQPSYRGTVRHRGWRVGRVALPPLAAPGARLVVTPAEVEIA